MRRGPDNFWPAVALGCVAIMAFGFLSGLLFFDAMVRSAGG